MSGFESTTTIERPIPVTERDVFVIGPLHEMATTVDRHPIRAQFDARMAEALEDYPADVRVVSIVPALTSYTDTSGDYPIASVVALFTVTVEWTVRS